MKQLHEISNSKDIVQMRNALQRQLHTHEQRLDKDLKKFGSGWYCLKFIGSSIGNLTLSMFSKVNYFTLGLSLFKYLFKKKK